MSMTVCLSLINTWKDGDAAAQWQPGESTILQVLITIQAMVFCEDPWRNEPGNGIAMQTEALVRARHYRLRRQPMTIKYGMLDWIKRLKRGQAGIWKDVVKTHFTINKDNILRNV